jgi:hypothetical protein
MGTTAREGLAWGEGVDVEGAQERLFYVVCEGHVVLNCVEASQHEIEQTDLSIPLKM